jgi:hypothetical protein
MTATQAPTAIEANAIVLNEDIVVSGDMVRGAHFDASNRQSRCYHRPERKDIILVVTSVLFTCQRQTFSNMFRCARCLLGVCDIVSRHGCRR